MTVAELIEILQNKPADAVLVYPCNLYGEGGYREVCASDVREARVGPMEGRAWRPEDDEHGLSAIVLDLVAQ